MLYRNKVMWGGFFVLSILVLSFQNCSKKELSSSDSNSLSLAKNAILTSKLSKTEARKKLVDEISSVKSVTWYVNYGTAKSFLDYSVLDAKGNPTERGTWVRNPEASAAEFVQQLPRIKQFGFNTVWISDHSTWSFMQPQPERYREGFNERELTLLKSMLDEARKNNMRVMLPLNGYGYGHWHADNPHMQYNLKIQPNDQGSEYDLCTWFAKPRAWNLYTHYVLHLLRELKDYHDMTYFFVFSEAASDDKGTRCKMTKSFYQDQKAHQVRPTYGNLPYILSTMDADIMNSVVMGFHDDHSIADAWVSADNLPISANSRFDFLSTHAYYDGYDLYPHEGNHVYLDTLGFSDIVSRIHKRLDRLKAASPHSKIFLGEFGISNCNRAYLPNNVLNADIEAMRSVFFSIRYALDIRGHGSNMWAWAPIYSEEVDICSGTTGGYYLTERLSQQRRLTPFAESIKGRF